jgi:kanamycin nucleotidyltransferase
VEQKRRELAEAMLAGAVCGSVAHGAAAEYSDVEVIVATDDSVPEGDEYFFDDGVMVECAVVQGERLLATAATVPWNWGIKADAHRHQLAIYDPAGFFDRLTDVAVSIPDEPFERALTETWWWCFETRGKFLNAAAAGDHRRAVYMGWEFAYAASMRIALKQRKPYESVRTLWSDVSSRGYEMASLLEALTGGASALREIAQSVDAVWSAIRVWNPPSSARAAP